MFSVKRQGKRITCSDKCLLVYKGAHYPCILENISVSGALLLCTEPLPKRMAKGESCGMLLCSDPELCPTEFRSKIARQESSKIALQFIET